MSLSGGLRRRPTLVIWGERDSYLHDEAERVNQLLIDFFAPAVA